MKLFFLNTNEHKGEFKWPRISWGDSACPGRVCAPDHEGNRHEFRPQIGLSLFGRRLKKKSSFLQCTHQTESHSLCLLLKWSDSDMFISRRLSLWLVVNCIKKRKQSSKGSKRFKLSAQRSWPRFYHQNNDMRLKIRPTLSDSTLSSSSGYLSMTMSCSIFSSRLFNRSHHPVSGLIRGQTALGMSELNMKRDKSSDSAKPTYAGKRGWDVLCQGLANKVQTGIQQLSVTCALCHGHLSWYYVCT